MSNYERWKLQAQEEFENSEFWEDSYKDSYEITESGDVYLGGYHWIHNVVTPWKESEFYRG